MKQLFSLLLSAALIFSFHGCDQENGSMTSDTAGGFSINGSVENGDSLLVLLDSRKDGEWINMDSAYIENGSFTLSGSVGHAEMAYLKFVDGYDIEYVYVFIENVPITVTGDADDVDNLVIAGSASNDLHAEFSKDYDAYYEIYDSLYSLYELAEDERSKDSLKRLFEKVEEDSEAFVKDYVSANKGSQVAAYLALRHMTYGSEYDELQPVVAAMSEEIGESKYLDALNETLEKLKVLAIGNAAPEFSQADADGNQVSLSSLRGKYVLVDFWASWCGPCRRENPNVVAMYNEFSGRGFEIIGVSLDKDREKWLKAIEDDKLAWEHVSDLQGWKNEVADLYNVKAIPSTYLLDKDGKIIAKNIRGDELKEKIREILDSAS